MLTLQVVKEKNAWEFSISIVLNYIGNFNYSINKISKITSVDITDDLLPSRKIYSSYKL